MIEKEKCSLQNAGIVETIVKCHFSLKRTDLFIAETVSKITNLHHDLVEDDLEEDLAAMAVIGVLDLVEETTDHVKCLTQNAETVETIVRCHSSLKRKDLFIAETVSKITDKIKKIVLSNFQNSFILYSLIEQDAVFAVFFSNSQYDAYWNPKVHSNIQHD